MTRQTGAFGFVLAVGICMSATGYSAEANATGSILVANRADGTISIIDVAKDEVLTKAPSTGESAAEPMYFVDDPERNQVFLGDRANDRIIVLDGTTFDELREIAAGAGIFHMWGDPISGQLWVVNDTAQEITVIDMADLKKITNFAIPADLSAFKPHDVVLDPHGGAAFVSMYDIEANNEDDWVVRYDTTTFEETHRTQTGDSPHLAISETDDGKLFVLAQAQNQVQVFNRADLTPMDPAVDVPAAHGAAIGADGQVLYTTNIAGGGKEGLFAVDMTDQSVIGQVDAPFPTPHNVAVSADGSKLYITHSGKSATQVSIYDLTSDDRVPALLGTVEAGLNPYGIVAIE